MSWLSISVGKLTRWTKRTLKKALTLLELLQEQWQRLPEPARMLLVQHAMQLIDGGFVYTDEDSLWRAIRKQRDTIQRHLLEIAYKL